MWKTLKKYSKQLKRPSQAHLPNFEPPIPLWVCPRLGYHHNLVDPHPRCSPFLGPCPLMNPLLPIESLRPMLNDQCPTQCNTNITNTLYSYTYNISSHIIVIVVIHYNIVYHTQIHIEIGVLLFTKLTPSTCAGCALGDETTGTRARPKPPSVEFRAVDLSLCP